MCKLIALRGMPGSGKSTYSAKLLKENPNLRRINKDMLRDMSNQGQFSPKDEATLNATLYFMTEEFLRNGFDVISDNMNLSDLHMLEFMRIAEGLRMPYLEPPLPAKIEVIDMDTPLDTCKWRDANRDRTVGVDIIDKIHDTWMNEDGTFPPLHPLVTKHDWISHKLYSEVVADD